MSLETLEICAFIWLAIAIAVHITMFFVTAPFGRHTSTDWGPMVNNKLGWIIMELPSLGIMVYFLFFGTYSFQSFVWILFACWIFHYLNRTFIYPLRIKATDKKMPLFIVLNAILFNCVNAGLNGYFLAELANPAVFGNDWISTPHFIIGATLFSVGLVINWKADNILIHLRKPGETGYKIPKGFLFDYISSPNLFGEIMEWTGFAIMAWNLPALTFMVWTFANLVPRAKNHHDWYHSKFKEYPKERKAVFPYIF
ncbi:MAG: 3-oxo-5-alpha-steroid 4-dehydrogenase 1 [Crocinitomix sp.]|jgi:3-oxo-5-alpha-steroid 4-dehydrogenase 1